MRFACSWLTKAALLAGAAFFSSIALGAGDSAAGQTQVAVCSACHGPDGASGIVPTYPNLAGQNEKYLLRQLQMIQSGERTVALMAGQLNAKTEQDLADLAAYYAALPGKVNQAQGDDKALAQAELIYRGGITSKGVAACTACHTPDGKGNASAGFPNISGQPSAYTIAQLTAYREGERVTDEGFGGMMRDLTEALTDGEIQLLADYLQGLY